MTRVPALMILTGASLLLSGCYTMIERPHGAAPAEPEVYSLSPVLYAYPPPLYGYCEQGDPDCSARRGAATYGSWTGDAVVQKKGGTGRVRDRRDPAGGDAGAGRVRTRTEPGPKGDTVRTPGTREKQEGPPARKRTAAPKKKKK